MPVPSSYPARKLQMLVTFHSKAWSNITLFGVVAVQLLKMMGHSGTVPSALRAGDIPAALARLRQELATIPDAETGHRAPTDQEDAETPVTLRARALPLIELLSASQQQGCDVLWNEGAPLV